MEKKLQIPENGSMNPEMVRALALALLGEETVKKIEGLAYNPDKELDGEEILPIKLTETDKFIFRISRFTNVIAREDFMIDGDLTESHLVNIRDTFNLLFWENLYGRVYACDPNIAVYGIRKDWTVVRVE